MFAEIQKDFSLKGKNEEEAARQFVRERGWGDSVAWHGAQHASCPKPRKGHWKTTGYGFYQGSDWNWRWFIGHRCTQCGCIVQFTQITDATGANPQPLTRNVIVP